MAIDKALFSAMGRVTGVALLALFMFGAKPEAPEAKAPVAKAVTVAVNAAKDEKEAPEASEDPAETARRALPAAKVDSDTLSLGFLEKAIELQQAGMVHRQPMNKEQAREFLDRLVDSMLMADEARRRGYGKDSEVVAITKNKLASLMHRRITDEVGQPEPTEEDLKKYYEDHYDTYHKPEKVRARHILIKDKTKAETLLRRAIENKVKQQEFRKMSKDNTEDQETQRHGGDLGFFPRTKDRKEGDPEIPEAIVEAAFKLEKNGDIAPQLIETDRGYHLVMRTGHRKKMDLSFEDSKERIKLLVGRELRKNQVEASINELKARYPVEIFEENLKYVVIDLSQTTGPKNAPSFNKR